LPIPVANPKASYAGLKEEILASIADIFESCAFVNGPNGKSLESEVAELCEAKHGIAVNSGTDAIVVALAACGVGRGDEVITTPFTFVATTEAIMIVGARPVFVDIDPSTFNLDAALIESKITAKTKAILPVHLYGQCFDTEAVEDVASKHGLKVIADGAQAIGAKRNGAGMGSFCDASTLSFYPTKNLGGCGDGGMVLTNDDDVAAMARSLRSHGQDLRYSYEHVGYCSRMDDIVAAVLRIKLRRVNEWNEARRSHANYYIEHLSGLPVKLPLSRPENHHIYHQFTLRFARRDELKAKLAEKGVGSAIYYPGPLHLERAYLDLGYRPGDFPECERAAAEVLSLPVYPELTPDEVNTVAQAAREAVEELV